MTVTMRSQRPDRRPRITLRAALLAYLALMPVMVLQGLPFTGSKLQPADVVFLAPLLLALASFRARREPTLPRLLAAWGCLLAAALASAIAAPRSAASLLEVAAYAYMGLIIFVVMEALRTWEDWIAAARAWIAASTGVALLGLAGIGLGLAGIATPFAQRVPDFFVIHRPVWTLSSTFIAAPAPNMACGYLLVGVLLSLGMSAHAGIRHRAWYAAAAVVHAAAILFTFSRGWMAAGLALVIFLRQFRTPSARLVTGAVAGAVIAFAILTELLAVWNVTGLSFTRSAEPRGGAGEYPGHTAQLDADVPLIRLRAEVAYVPYGRALLRKAELAMFSERPLLGIGPGRFAHELYRRQREEGERWSGLRVAAPWDPHSTYLGALAELGAFGFAAVCLVMGVVISEGVRAVRRSVRAGSPHAPLAWAIFGCVVAYAAWGWHDDLLTKRWVWAAAAMASSAALLLVEQSRYAKAAAREPGRGPLQAAFGAAASRSQA